MPISVVYLSENSYLYTQQSKIKSMKRLCTVLLLTAVFAATALATGITGKWKGELSTVSFKLPLVFNFKSDGAALSCTLDSPMQNAYGLQAQAERVGSDSIVVTLPMLGAEYRGYISGDTMTGSFSQSGLSISLELKREELQEAPADQKKVYQSVDTVFTAADGITLAGTLTLPLDKKKYPLVVMVTGSGPQNRDEELLGHKPFAVIADYLARHGIASLRYDDRGVGSSKGDFAASTLRTFCSDAAAATAFARTLNGVSSVGVLGHSEGGTIAFMLAEQGIPDFIVSLAGMAVSGKETILDQNRRTLKAINLSDRQIESSLQLLDETFSALSAAERASDVDIESIIAKYSAEVPPAMIQAVRGNAQSFNGYLRDLVSVDVRPDMSEIKCPVLALNGSLDMQVAPEANIQAISRGVKHAQTHIMPGLNHLFQHATTGSPAEYGLIQETISPEVLQMVATFIEEITAQK